MRLAKTKETTFKLQKTSLNLSFAEKFLQMHPLLKFSSFVVANFCLKKMSLEGFTFDPPLPTTKAHSCTQYICTHAASVYSKHNACADVSVKSDREPGASLNWVKVLTILYDSEPHTHTHTLTHFKHAGPAAVTTQINLTMIYLTVSRNGLLIYLPNFCHIDISWDKPVRLQTRKR